MGNSAVLTGNLTSTVNCDAFNNFELLARISHQGGEMIAQQFGFTKDFAKKWNNCVYFRLSKILCKFKDQARARPSGEKCGLASSIRSCAVIIAAAAEENNMTLSSNNVKYYKIIKELQLKAFKP